MGDSKGDRLSQELGADFARFIEIEELLPTDAARADYGEDHPDRMGDDDRAAHRVAAAAVARFDVGAAVGLEQLHDRLEVVAAGLAGNDWERVNRVSGVVLEAIAFVDDAVYEWADGHNPDLQVGDERPPGWRWHP